MAQRKTEAWLTTAIRDDTVANALILAESLRRTKTTKTIGVITSRDVSTVKRNALGMVFDAVFCMDDVIKFPGEQTYELQEIRAKFFAFSLYFLGRCVFVSPSSLVLENLDKLFEDDGADFKFLKNTADDFIDLSLFMFETNKGLWKHLLESIDGKAHSESFLKAFLLNQKNSIKIRWISEDTVANFSITHGLLTCDKTHASLIRFAEYSGNLSENMEMLTQLGLREKLVVDNWLEIFHEKVSPVLLKPESAASLFSCDDEGHYKREPIAIIGMSCRYPGANTLEEFWNILYQGDEGIRGPPKFRWIKEHTLHVTKEQLNTNAGFLSTTVDEFDAKFFGISPKEATFIDPQVRLLHEVLWESLEDSGIDPLSLYATHTGIFTGSWTNDYRDIAATSAEKDFFRTYMGNSIGAAAARLSFLLGLTGPCIATESGCSSSITAVDLAVKSLRSGESNLAIAGGVNLLLHPFTSDLMDFIIAPNGRCKTFDANADGFGRAEGCGVLVLKRLSDALRDRDHIWAMIRGSAISQEGLSKSLGTPTAHCEALAMQLALRDANVHPQQVSFVEAHATGTAVGDPLEVAAISKAYSTPLRKTPLMLGSVKTNVGHTESCSGITGIMKTILAMHHEIIPKHRNLESLNPEIFLDYIPAIIPLEPVVWPKVKGQPRIAGVSSFGITGTDGHVIIQEAPEYALPKFNLQLERPAHILKISAKTPEALDELISRYETLFSDKVRIESDSENTFADAAYTANVGRATFTHRAFIVAQNYKQAVKIITEKTYLQAEVKRGETRQICFLFTGQGSQYHGMAKTLYETSPIFRVHFDTCDKTLREMYNLSIREVLWESDSSPKTHSRTIYSQTSIFCVEYCLLKLWQSWGVQPDYVLGHSLGEFCAAVAAEILDFKDALKLVAERSYLIDSLPQGSMLAIKASKQEVKKLLKSAKIDLDLAAENNPEQTVVAGNTEKVQEFLAYIDRQGVKTTILEATHAFHSRHMDTILEKYKEIAETINYKQGSVNIQYISGTEGKIISGHSELSADYWVRHAREKVSFTDACAVLRNTGCQDCLEIGAQPILSAFVMMNSEDVRVNCFPSLRRGTKDWDTILTSLGKLFLLGHKIDWKGYDESYVRNKVSLPLNPFQKKSCWLELANTNVAMIHPLLGYPLNNASTLNIFQNDLNAKSLPYIKDHCIGERIIFPGAGYTEMCLTAGYCVANGLTETFELPGRAMRLENVRITAPLELKAGKICRFQTIVDLPEAGKSEEEQQPNNQGFHVKVFHQNTLNEESDKWVLHASANFIPVASSREALKKWNPRRISDIMSQNKSKSAKEFYKRVDQTGLRFGESFRSITRVWTEERQGSASGITDCVTEMTIPSDSNKYVLHPLIIDAAFQSSILKTQIGELAKLTVPVSIGQLTVFSGVELCEGNSDSLYLYAWSAENEKQGVYVSTSDYTPIALIEDVELVHTTAKTIESILEQQSSSIPDAWEEVWKVIPSPFTSAIQAADLTSVFASLEEHVRPWMTMTEKDLELQLKTKRLLYLYILNAFYELGWVPYLGEHVTLDLFCLLLGIKTDFQKLVRFYFTVFVEETLFSKNDNQHESWTVTNMSGISPEEIKMETDVLFYSLKSSKVVKVYEKLSRNLSKILTGEMSALSLLFPSDEEGQQYSAEQMYLNYPERGNMTKIFSVVVPKIVRESRKYNQHNPGKIYRVLEAGSGTGSLTEGMLNELKQIWGDNFEYYFTDISQSFLVKAEKRFDMFKQNIKYTLFNIEQAPLSQGIPLNYFDAVVAQDVIHATKNLKESLVHLRQVLRPGGVLSFTDTVAVSRDITFLFGLLEGYWRFEDFEWRQHHCCVEIDVWMEVMKQSGFESVQSFKITSGHLGNIVAIASPEVQVSSLRLPLSYDDKTRSKLENMFEWILFLEESNIRTLSEVANMLDANRKRVTIILKNKNVLEDSLKGLFNNTVKLEPQAVQVDENWFLMGSGHENKLEGVIYAWGMDMNERDQSNVALPFLHIAKTLVCISKPPLLFVLTQGVHAINDGISCHPSAATLFGMTKSLKNETPNLFVRYVDFEQRSLSYDVVNQVLYELAMCKESKEKNRVQVAYRNNVRYEPRLCKISLHAQSNELKLPPSTDRYHLVLPSTRVIQDLKYGELDKENVEKNDVEVEVKAYALNFRDIFSILKPSAQFEQLNQVGVDFGGTVTKVGNSSWLTVGDRVFGINFKENQLSSHVVVDSRFVLRIPDQMTFCEAATLPTVFHTAYYGLITTAKLKKGETVLIHTGAGGVGLAAIQVASHVGANIITTAGNSRKRAYLRSLGIEHVFHSRNTSFEKNILKVTNGKGVDVVLNSITGPGIKEATLNASSQNARFVEMSKLSVWSTEEVKVMRPDVDYQIIDLSALKEKTLMMLFDVLRDVLSNGQLKFIPYVKFDALNIRQAFQYFQKAKHIGKVVCSMPHVVKEEGQFKVKTPLFNRESTYVITGGMGGIGFEVCKWMLVLGATDIVLTGRSPPNSEVQEQVAILNKKGFNVAMRLGDVGNYDQCKMIISEIAKALKPLRGVMHCAGVLSDKIYANQTWDDFQTTFNPKVTGTWNLHKLTMDLPLEHFVLYSSASALLGLPGQANHAAANCFEDSFIHYRHSLGLKGSTVNWGHWVQVGCAKDSSISGVLPVSVKRMLNGLEMAMKTQKIQISFCEFDSFSNLSILCPMTKFYLDEKVRTQNASAKSNNLVSFKSDSFWKEMDAVATRTEKMVVVIAYIKAILRNALLIEQDEPIKDNANLQELGVDSLMMLELRNSIQSLLGSRLTININLMKDCNTILLIANALVDRLLEEKDEDDGVSGEPLSSQKLLELLSTDSVLPEYIHPESALVTKASEIRTVFVTGVTGKLAPYLISQLCQHHNSVEKIVCLVRGKSEDDKIATEKLKAILSSMHLSSVVDMSKIECVVGDVAIENLNLSQVKYNELCRSVDAVIHCAVKSHYSEHYKSSVNRNSKDIRSVNVIGTLNVLKFASKLKPKHVFYPSTLVSGIWLGREEGIMSDEWPEFDDSMKSLVTVSPPGLTVSKFVCELLLKQANERGIPCKVFRLPWIAGASKTGQLSYLNNLYILRFLGFLKVNAMPCLVIPANFIPVDICAELSLKLFLSDETPFEIFNLGHPQPQNEQEFAQLAKEEFGRNLEILEWPEFTKLLKNNDTHKDYFTDLFTDQQVLNMYLAEGTGIMGMSCHMTLTLKIQKCPNLSPTMNKLFRPRWIFSEWICDISRLLDS